MPGLRGLRTGAIFLPTPKPCRTLPPIRLFFVPKILMG